MKRWAVRLFCLLLAAAAAGFIPAGAEVPAERTGPEASEAAPESEAPAEGGAEAPAPAEKAAPAEETAPSEEAAPEASVTPAASGESPVLLRNGGSFLLAVREDGSIIGWGDNRRGQLGMSAARVQVRPVPAAEGLNGNDLKDIQCGNNNTLFLMKDGTVYTCGTYSHGTQGLGPLKHNVNTPVRIPALSRIVQIACGFGHNAALDEDGHLWVWGRNDLGQLGIGNRKGQDTPVMLDLENIVDVTCGGKFMLARAADGREYGWGSNAWRVLEDSSRKEILSPVELAGLDGLEVTAFAGGSDMAFWLDSDGTLWSRGRNELNQCGSREAAPRMSPNLSRVDIPEKVVRIVGYSSVPIALTEGGNAYIWGCTTNGQIGKGKNPGAALPTAGWDTGDCVQVAAGSIFTSLLTADGRIYVTGYNAYGQLGNGNTSATFSWTWNGTNVRQTGQPKEEALAALEAEKNRGKD